MCADMLKARSSRPTFCMELIPNLSWIPTAPQTKQLWTQEAILGHPTEPVDGNTGGTRAHDPDPRALDDDSHDNLVPLGSEHLPPDLQVPDGLVETGTVVLTGESQVHEEISEVVDPLPRHERHTLYEALSSQHTTPGEVGSKSPSTCKAQEQSEHVFKDVTIMDDHSTHLELQSRKNSNPELEKQTEKSLESHQSEGQLLTFGDLPIEAPDHSGSEECVYNIPRPPTPPVLLRLPLASPEYPPERPCLLELCGPNGCSGLYGELLTPSPRSPRSEAGRRTPRGVTPCRASPLGLQARGGQSLPSPSTTSPTYYVLPDSSCGLWVGILCNTHI